MKTTTVKVRRSLDRFSLDVETSDRRQREQHVNYRLDRFRGLGKRHHEPWLSELLELGTALYAADRLISRPRQWGRPIAVELPVSSARRQRWEEAKGLLRELFHRTTGDDVELTLFEQDLERRSAPMPLGFEAQSPVRVALLSDGLDSAAGAVSRLAVTTDAFAFVSVITKTIRDERIAAVRNRLKTVFGASRVIPRLLNVSLVDPERDGETTQRFRTILSVIAGLTVAAAEGSGEIEIFENGIGILNLPAPNVQLPYESSQVLSPGNSSLWTDIAQLLLGRAIQIRYPFRWHTKAELCSALTGELSDVIGLTRSCDGEHRVPDKGLRECGVCGSCLSRQIAVAQAGIASSLDAPYRTPEGPYHRGINVRAVYHLHERALMQSLDHPDPWQELTRLYPTLRTSVAHDGYGAVPATIDLLRRHREELSAYLTLHHAA